MVNIEAFSKRLTHIIDYHELSASAFADKIGVQRSSISHLLSGRNKPSLDFILKVLEEFPDAEWEWLLHNKGTYPKSKKETPNLFTPPVTNTENKNTDTIPKQKDNNPIPPSLFKKSIEQIIIFYTDGTFKNYQHLNE